MLNKDETVQCWCFKRGSPCSRHMLKMVKIATCGREGRVTSSSTPLPSTSLQIYFILLPLTSLKNIFYFSWAEAAVFCPVNDIQCSTRWLPWLSWLLVGTKIVRSTISWSEHGSVADMFCCGPSNDLSGEKHHDSDGNWYVDCKWQYWPGIALYSNERPYKPSTWSWPIFRKPRILRFEDFDTGFNGEISITCIFDNCSFIYVKMTHIKQYYLFVQLLDFRFIFTYKIILIHLVIS